jgi:hypothetical protein
MPDRSKAGSTTVSANIARAAEGIDPRRGNCRA